MIPAETLSELVEWFEDLTSDDDKRIDLAGAQADEWMERLQDMDDAASERDDLLTIAAAISPVAFPNSDPAQVVEYSARILQEINRRSEKPAQ